MARPRPRIVVVGGGFGGLYAASYLGRSELVQDGATVTLIDKKNYFSFTPLLSEVAGGALSREHVIHGYRSLGHQYGFTFRQAAAEGVDPAAQTVHTTAGPMPYDYLVLGPGAEPSYFGNADLQQHSQPMVSVDDATCLHDRVVSSLEAATQEHDPARRDELLTVVVAGAGPAGVETASEIQHFANDVLRPYYPGLPPIKVLLVSAGDKILLGFDEQLAALGLERLRSFGIDVRLNTKIIGAGSKTVRTEAADGTTEEIRAATLVWTAGTRPAAWLGATGLPLERGALRVLRTLQVDGCPNVFGIGDAAALTDERSGMQFPRVAPIALSQGIRAAANIENMVAGRSLECYHAHHAGKIVSLGRGVALVELLGFRLTGWPAWMMYRSAYLMKLVGTRNKVRVALTLMLNQVFERDVATVGTRGRGAA